MKFFLVLIVFTLSIFSCQRKDQVNYNDFFEQVYDIIKEKSIKKNDLDWDELRQSVVDSIGQFNNNEDVYRAISYTINLIADGHSIFLNTQLPNKLEIDTLKIPDIKAEIIENDIGYLKLTGFVANLENSKTYSEKIRKSLYELDSTSEISGWIIDVRENLGGLSSMMPLGLAPLFQDSLIGFRVNNKGEFISEICTPEYYRFGPMKDEVSGFEYNLKNKNKPISVLISPKTASAGETLASAFRFQPQTQLIGLPTKGKTTSLELITFKSGVKLLLATLYLCNKNKEIVKGAVTPDIKCDPEDAWKLGIKWIRKSYVGNSNN